MPTINEFHNPYYDPMLHEAHTFVTSQLGLDVSPLEQVAVINPEQGREFRRHFQINPRATGGFNTQTKDIAVFADFDRRNTDGALTRTAAKTVHELTHSGTTNNSEHEFFNEAIAGLGEQAYLGWLQTQGRWKPVADYVLEQAGAVLRLPGDHRYYASSPWDPPSAISSNGLIAAVGLELGMQQARVTTKHIMGVSKLDGTEQFTLMKHAVDALKPGLAKEVESYPSNIDGIIQATAAIQTEALRQGITN